jgi:low affinity Fe/Cu permease
LLQQKIKLHQILDEIIRSNIKQDKHINIGLLIKKLDEKFISKLIKKLDSIHDKH